jgi:hypothetical protein
MAQGDPGGQHQGGLKNDLPPTVLRRTLGVRVGSNSDPPSTSAAVLARAVYLGKRTSRPTFAECSGAGNDRGNLFCLDQSLSFKRSSQQTALRLAASQRLAVRPARRPRRISRPQ